MISQTDLSKQNAFDLKGLGELRQSAKAKEPEALKTAATQFEAMFLNMMMKSMRDATPQDGVMDSQQSKMYTSMLDQQTSQNLAKRGTGLADVLMRQLTQVAPAPDADVSPRSSTMAAALEAFRAQQQGAGAPAAAAALKPAAAAGVGAGSQAPHVRAFQEKLGGHAAEASRATGIPAKFMLGQAALESGWGKREIKGRDGAASHNLFGIKAGPEWKGKVAEAVTTEYVNGVPKTRTEKFRAYDSYADSFRDYAKLITDNKRYEKVLASAGDASSFAQGLQRAGYATDPHYAAKLTRIIKHSLVG
ncbi:MULTISPECIES: flagellar assembly peptidoglycan hydrolase FlgJ [unclassified Janthinobacterium]|uniref:flagellar assembly peptidoglycan hydrolase FlgJ n=1 Tax=unclassified Janthinobacterium TaxID=2610881 RepID=UPI00034ABA23|nr:MULTISPECIES: flagellar assembly peptidoglycan hydrolase FlgJ [unclassified Janthinobacterium]MEC5162261.1 flagellar protein FlgJ [Janthinobacterium sp. CG_S6]